jgi:serine/threonine protein kinase
MGEVFSAVAVGADGFQKPVVIKRLLPKFAGRADVVNLLAAEAKLMTRLIHPNIVQVIDFGRGENDDYFLVMELVSGIDFGKFCEAYAASQKRVPIPIALFVITQVLRGLAYAHASASADGARLVHRDVSPGNVLLSTFGEVKVGDFGVALVASSAEGETHDGWLVGKPAYMAPEQLEREPVDERADIFAVGAVLFQTLTGSSHREDAQPKGGNAASFELSAESRAALAAAAPPDVAEIVVRALAPRRDDRYASAREMARDIELLAEKGQRIASADELAEAVSEVVRLQPKRGKSVVVLSGGTKEAFASGTELTRTESRDHKNGFTLKIHDSPVLSPSLPVEARQVSLPPTRRKRAGLGLGVFAFLALATGLAVRGQLRASHDAPAGSHDAPAGSHDVPAASHDASAATAIPSSMGVEPGDQAVDAERVELARAATGAPETTSTVPSAEPPMAVRSHANAHPKEPVREPEIAPASAPAPMCRGQLHLYATHGWLLSGGPGTVQAPGRYDWPCGTYALKAISRTDAQESRSVTVTIREGAPGVIDLR